jgi:V/A-type H+-transporting ATPase subunit D
MAKIKHTKNELKFQREALKRYQRFLPMLQLKKQQLQAEIQAVDVKMAERRQAEGHLVAEMEKWVRLFSSDDRHDCPAPGLTGPAQHLENLVVLNEIVTEEGNIAGVPIPLLLEVRMTRRPPDLFASPSWFDDAAEAIERRIRLRVEMRILQKQRDQIAEELRITSQRVNLFEKVKIPECRENIRVIKIFLGDEQTAGVVRGKFAKSRTLASEEQDRAA